MQNVQYSSGFNRLKKKSSRCAAVYFVCPFTEDWLHIYKTADKTISFVFFLYITKSVDVSIVVFHTLFLSPLITVHLK